jgi:hypothetical protein
MEKIHNLYITSTNKQGSDTNYNYNIYFSNYGIVIGQDEEAYLNIKTFQTLNSFYNINENSKSFKIKIITDNDMTLIYDFEIETGNYDIYNFMSAINSLCSLYINMTYNEKKNKWNYTNIYDINSEVFLIPNKYNASYFGLKPDYNNEILTPINGIGTYSNIINMNNFSLIIIKIIGLIEENKNIDNFNNLVCRGDIGAIVNRQDVAVGALINWTDINNSFIKKINNIEINSLNFKFTNEMGEELFDINEWLLTISITIRKKQHQPSQ